jgi:hypothetical protein
MNNKIGVNLLRQTGIILIALPEPVTTVLGIACIAAAQYISGSQEKAHPKFISRKKLNKFPQDFFFPGEFDNSSLSAKRLNYYSYDRCRRHRIAVRNQYRHRIEDAHTLSYVKPQDIQTIHSNNIKSNLEYSARIKMKEIILSREHSNPHIRTVISNPELNIDALTRRYKYLNERKEADTKTEKCYFDMKKLQKYRDNEKKQYEWSTIKAAESEIKFHEIDMDTLMKRYGKSPLRHSMAA